MAMDSTAKRSDNPSLRIKVSAPKNKVNRKPISRRIKGLLIFTSTVKL
jgi:hypothetical protein